jgi:mannose-1-phosphate guanylyltransferase
MRQVLQAGFEVCRKKETGVIYGIWPSRPEIGFGYVQLGTKLGEFEGIPYHKVAAFKEKPDQETAEEYVVAKEFLWNGGIFVWTLRMLMLEIKESLPKLFYGLEQFVPYIGKPDENEKLTAIYPTLPAISVDYGILEKTQKLVVIPTDYGWDDLGSWSALERFLPHDEFGNVVQGKHIGVDTRDCIIHSPKKVVTTLGVSGLIIVETDDVLMVCNKDQAQNIKKLLKEVSNKERQDLL